MPDASEIQKGSQSVWSGGEEERAVRDEVIKVTVGREEGV